ncbi:MAG: ABC transporter ATP-binding protein, partial [Victivallales bacterium]
MINKNNKFQPLVLVKSISSLLPIPLFTPILRFSDSPIQFSSSSPASSSPSSPRSPLPATRSFPNVLEISGLKVYFNTVEGELHAVDGVSFSMRRGKVMALVGESGCGKSVTSYSVLRLIQSPGKIVGGSMMFYPAGEKPADIAKLSDNDELLYHIRGGKISMIFQEPMTALSPVHTVGNQICEAILLHQKVTEKEAEHKAVEMLRKVGISGPEKRISQYPFEMSGGMRQRVMIAMALVC